MAKQNLVTAILMLGVAACAEPQPTEKIDHHHGTKVAVDHFDGGAYKPHTHGAMVEFTYDDVAPLEIGERTGINMIVDEEYATGTITLEALDSDGVSVFGAARTLRLNAADGSSHNWRIDIEAERPGSHYVGLIATVEMEDGFSEVRTSAIRIEVIDPNPPSKEQVEVSQKVEMQLGEPVVIMEAVETVED